MTGGLYPEGFAGVEASGIVNSRLDEKLGEESRAHMALPHYYSSTNQDESRLPKISKPLANGHTLDDAGPYPIAELKHGPVFEIQIDRTRLLR